MARPKKNNADYFSHDANMRDDSKIKMLRRKFGLEGYAIWNMILEFLADCEDFKYKYNEMGIEIMSGDFNIDPTQLQAIIEYMIKFELLFHENGLIFSKQQIKRFAPLLSKRKRDRKEVITSDND